MSLGNILGQILQQGMASQGRSRLDHAVGSGGIGDLLGGLLASDELGEDEIESLKQGDMLESSFGEFAKSSPQLYETVIAERDRYMAARLRESAGEAREVLAVVGAGHHTRAGGAGVAGSGSV